MSFEHPTPLAQFVVNRRNFLGMALASGTALTLAACSQESTSTDSSSSSSESETRVVKNVDDEEITVPSKPQRVVVLSEPTLDAVLALGVTPVGTISGRGQQTVPNYLKDKAGDVPIIGSVSEVNYEKVGALNPDLILADSTGVDKRSEAYKTLQDIAPVVYTGYAGGDWTINFERVADALNMVDQGKKVEEDYKSLTENLKKELEPQYGDKTFSIVRWAGNGPALILKELPAGQVLSDLGLQRPPAQDREGQGHSEPVSLENLADIDADYMFLGTLGGASQKNPDVKGDASSDGAAEVLKKAEATSGFTNLKAYQNDHIITVEGSKWTSTGGPLLMNGIVADVRTKLIDNQGQGQGQNQEQQGQ